MRRADDLRLGSLVSQEVSNPANKVAIIGYPCDEGVKRNGGRLGSAQGPHYFRQYYPKIGSVINPEFRIDLHKIDVADYGDAFESDAAMELEQRHELLTLKVKEAMDDGYLPFVVGGGNDQSYPNAKALMDYLATGDIAVINIDAHLDVRSFLGPKKQAHSGSPFRQLLEDDNFRGTFVEFACQGAVCGAEHVRFVKDKGVKIFWLNTIRKKGSVSDQFCEILKNFGNKPIFVSFDADSIQSSDCPGVSSPATIGLTAAEALAICQEAGRNKNITLFDLSEFNPVIEYDRTSRLVAHMFYYFLLGVAER